MYLAAVGVATLNANSVKKQRINAKSQPSKCSGLAISRRRQIYAMIGVEKDIFVRTHLHMVRIVVRIKTNLKSLPQSACIEDWNNY